MPRKKKVEKKALPPTPAPPAQAQMPSPPTLQPYQQYAENFILTHPFCGVFFDMGLGKAIDDEAEIPTYYGPRKIKTLTVNDTLLDMDGEICHIQHVFHHTNITAYEITLTDNRKFICSEDHLLPLLKNPYSRTIAPTALKDILGEDLMTAFNPRQYRYAIPVNFPAQHPERGHLTQLDPATLGCILATAEYNGSDRLRFELSAYDGNPEHQARVRAHLNRLAKNYGSKCLHYVENGFIYHEFETDLATKALINDLKNIGCGDKLDTIPESYLYDSIRNRTELLTAIMGATENVGQNVIYKSCQKIIRANYFAKFETLANGIRQLIYSLGFSCQVLNRKSVNRIEIRAKLHYESGMRVYIRRIRKVKNRNMTCFTVTSPSHTYLINDYIPTHNTLITLSALYKKNPHGHVLVIAPKNIARNTWLDEIKKWHLPLRTKSFICDENYKPLTRKARLERYAAVQTDRPTIYFINRELFPDLTKHMPRINGRETWYFPHVIVDESQSFKNYASVRFKAMQRIRPCLQSMVILTGTPTPKDLMDLWSQIYMLDMGWRLGKNITAYRRTFFREVLYVNGHCVKWEPLPGAEEEIYRRINDIVISAKNTVIKLPPITYNYFTVYMEPDEWDLYKQFAKDAVMDVDCNMQVTAANRGVLHNKLSQLASGTIYIDDQHNYKVIHKHKIEAVQQIIAGSSGPVMVAYFYNSDRELLLQEVDGARLFDGSPAMLEEWSNGEIPVLLVHPASSGHGLNFQYGGHVLVWYTIPDNLEHYLQTNARLYRNGQTQPVIIHHIVTDKTVDVTGIPSLETKEAREQRLLDAVKIAVGMLDD